ncbi:MULTISPECIES: hypothetical protein [Calothrix]|uniref:Uncharacterized protein n=2 Tax=Calothrix TaxID=1186 RepID=A0ABR8ADC2_9CYAN|nr:MULTISPECIES: hypothetical protein [Calothrix]MBD2197928.1 hypothetical protein [Calothrix parietina FACHB-288]MBD2226787.1 hypothetical protein [Calothrix anomala FACHB-343]
MINSDIPNFTPDPAWDYYIIWHRCLRAKAKIELALAALSKQEELNLDTNESCDDLILEAIAELNQIDFEKEEDEDED